MNSRKLNFDFKRTPPNVINLDQPDAIATKVLDALTSLAKQIFAGSIIASESVTEQWDSIWGWILSLSRAVLDQRPSTPAGREFVNLILDPLPVLFLHQVIPYQRRNNGKQVSVHKLEPILISTPQIVALSLELWLLASEIALPSLPAFCDSARLYSEASVINIDTPGGKAAKRYVDRLLVSPRWDVSRVFVEYLIREIGRPVLEHLMAIDRGMSIIGFLSAISALKPGQVNISFIKGLLQRDAPKWITILFRKLTTPRNYQNKPASVILPSVRQCLGFFNVFFQYFDNYSVVNVLDAGFIISMFKHRDLVVHDFRSVESKNLAKLFAYILQCIKQRLYYRQVLVRVISSLKKAEKKGFDIECHFEDCGVLHDSWVVFLEDANMKHIVYKNWDDSELGWYDTVVCGYQNCPDSDSLTSKHKFRRCSGCSKEIYCSTECQKMAWRSGHREECSSRRVEGDQGPSSIDVAYFRKCTYHDYFSLDEDCRVSYRLNGLVVLMKYQPGAVLETKGIPVHEAKSIAKVSKQDRAFGEVAAVACLAWNEGKVVTVTIRPQYDK